MKRSFNVHTLALVLLLAVLGTLLALAGLFIAAQHKQTQQSLGDIETRYARLLGLKASVAELDRGTQEATALLAKHAYPAAQDANQAGNDAQQRVRALFASAGLDVVSIQVLPPKAEKSFDRIPLTVRLEGQLTNLQSAMLVLGTQTPTVFVDGFSVQAMGFVRAEIPQRLGMQFNLYVLRVLP